MLAYLDTNVFDNLLKRTNGITEADELRLRAAITSRQLTIVASHIKPSGDYRRSSLSSRYSEGTA